MIKPAAVLLPQDQHRLSEFLKSFNPRGWSKQIPLADQYLGESETIGELVRKATATKGA